MNQMNPGQQQQTMLAGSSQPPTMLAGSSSPTNQSQLGAAMDPIAAQRAADGNGGPTLYSQGRNMFAPENQGQNWSMYGQSGPTGSAGGAALGGQWQMPQYQNPTLQTQGQGVGPYTNPQTPGWQYGVGQAGNVQTGVQGAGGIQSQVGAAGNIQNNLQSGGIDTNRIDGANMPVGSVGPGQQYQSQMQDAYMDQARSRLDPQWQQREEAMATKLSNQGITPGSEAWNNAMRQQAFERNDAYGQATNQAILNSGAEAQRMQGMDIAGGNFENQAAQQNFQNDLTSQQQYNAAQGQQFGQNLQAGQFGNQAQNQQFGQNLASMQVGNVAQGQQFGQNLQSGQFANSAQAQQFAQQAQDAAVRNGAMTAGGGLLNQWNLGQQGNAMDRYRTDVGAMSDRYRTDVGAQTATNTANIGMQSNLGSAGMAADVARQNNQMTNDRLNRGMDWDQMIQGAQLPFQLQNLMMSGMYPTGMPQTPNVPNAGSPPTGNFYNSAGAQQGQNNNFWGNAGSFAGNYLGQYFGP